MAPFDRAYTTSYQPAIVSTATFCTIFNLLDLAKYRDVEIYARVTRPAKLCTICTSSIIICMYVYRPRALFCR